MTTATEDSSNPLAGYFSMEPLLGGGGDPFHWDADLAPEEYGDQSALWDDDKDDNASFTDDDDFNEDDDLSQGSHDCNEEGDWSIVYAASFTVVASSAKPLFLPASAPAVPCPPPAPLTRRDSKVRFCDQPPKTVTYEGCSREEHSSVYYSVHELQKIIDEVRLEKKTTTATSSSPTNNYPKASRSA